MFNWHNIGEGVVNILLIVGLLIGFPLAAFNDRTLANWLFSLVYERDSRCWGKQHRFKVLV